MRKSAKKMIKESRYRSTNGRTYTEAELAVRKAHFFEPVRTKEQLRLFLKVFFNLELPDYIIDEESTSTPLQFVWDIYQTMMTDVGPKNYVVAASRNSAKTLCSAIIHMLSMIHFRRTCVHIAATKTQSRQCMKYMDSFCRLPEVSEYFVADNTEERRLEGMPANWFTVKDHAEISIAVATPKGTNAKRGNCLNGTTRVLVEPQTEHQKRHATCAAKTVEGVWRDIQRGIYPKILTYNQETHTSEMDTVVAAQRRRELHRLRLWINETQYIECTKEHPIGVDYDDNGSIIYRNAGDLVAGDYIFQYSHQGRIVQKPEPQYPIPAEEIRFVDTYTLDDLLLGLMLGDGCLVNRHKKEHTASYLQITKSVKCREYMSWICEKLNSCGIEARIRHNGSISGYTQEPLDMLVTKSHPILTQMYHIWYPNHQKIIPNNINLTQQAFVQWVMDDGSFFRTISSCNFTIEENQFLIEKINELFGYDCAILSYDKKQDGRIYPQISLRWPYDHKHKLCNLFSHIHPDFSYKIPIRPKPCVQCGKLFYFATTNNVCEAQKCQMLRTSKILQKKTITKIEPVVVTHPRGSYVYDLQTEKNHNFIADTFLVHNCLIKDEVDQTPREVIAEVAGVLDPTLDEHQFSPICIGLSSRKSNDGPLQDDIDESERDKAEGKPERIRLVKFSMVDWMKPCTTSGAPAGNLYLNINTLKTIYGEEEYKLVPESEQSQYKCYPIYESCRACPALIPCFGRTVKQVVTSPRLRNIEFVSTVIRAVKDPNVIAAQYLNWRPETTGVVFNTFQPYRHVGNMHKIFEWVTGIKYPETMPITMEFLVTFLRKMNYTIAWGIDWGSSDPASCVVLAYNRERSRAVVLKVLTMSGYANSHWATYCREAIPKCLHPDYICPDTEDPNSWQYFKGFDTHVRREKPKKILTGVSQIRGLLWDPTVQTHGIMWLLDDRDPDRDGMLEAIRQMQHWKHRKTPLGGWDMKSFQEGEDHCIDPKRYVLDLLMKHKSRSVIASEEVPKTQQEATVSEQLRQTYFDNGAPMDAFDRPPQPTGRRWVTADDPINQLSGEKKSTKGKVFVI